MAYTINTGTMLSDKADALMWESLRLESEPWTRFYMAGEIIRESRKTSGAPRGKELTPEEMKAAKHGNDLETSVL
jgi:hypothetical protein